jgi:hypothetical protein
MNDKEIRKKDAIAIRQYMIDINNIKIPVMKSNEGLSLLVDLRYSLRELTESIKCYTEVF